MEEKPNGARSIENQMLKAGNKFWAENLENKTRIRFGQL